MVQDIKSAFEADIDDGESSSGETIYHDETMIESAPNLHAPVDHTMLQTMENKWNGHRLAADVRSSVHQVGKLANETDKRAREKADGIDIMLEELGCLKTITAEFAKNIALERVLGVLKSPERKMSAATRKKAQELYQRFERQNWGEAAPLAASTTGSKAKMQVSATTPASGHQTPLNGSSDLGPS